MSENEEDYDMIFKILIIGDSGVGKSNLLLRYTKDEFMPDMRATVGVEFGTKMMEIDGQQIKIQIWDTAGQERYRAITSAYYKGAKGVLIVFDVTKRDSFENTTKWLNDFKMKCEENAATVLVGNKIDLKDEREVSEDDAKAYAEEMGMAYFETSAKTNDNVDKAFISLIKSIVNKTKGVLDEGNDNSNKNKNNTQKIEEGKSVKLKPEEEEKEENEEDKKKGCC